MFWRLMLGCKSDASFGQHWMTENFAVFLLIFAGLLEYHPRSVSRKEQYGTPSVAPAVTQRSDVIVIIIDTIISSYLLIHRDRIH